MLRLEGICAAYGSIIALQEVSLTIAENAIVAIIGPNGAGKTTLFKVVSGVVTPSAGRVLFCGEDLLRIDPARRAAMGIAHVPEGRQVFKSMTVLENLEMGAFCHRDPREAQRAVQRSLDLFPMLAERRGEMAGRLSGGQQQLLAIGRGLACNPKLLLLDEPSMGLSPVVAEQVFERIGVIHRAGGLTVVLVEQRVAEALESCDWGYVLDTGRIVLGGSPDTLRSDSRVRDTYLGTSPAGFATP